MKGNIKEQVITAYINGISIKDITSTYNIAHSTIYKWIRNKGIIQRGKRTYTINEDYFSIIDSAEKAYILGFIYADGCVTNDRLTITLHVQDENILKFIKSEMNSKMKFYFFKNRSQVSFSVYSKRISNDLKSLNIVERKTYSKLFPLIPNEFISFFISGYFDGDGCVYCKKNGNCSLIFTCYNQNVLDKLQELLLNQFNINSKVTKKSNSGFDLRIQRKSDIKLFYNLIYVQSPFKLLRKQDKLYNWIQNNKHYKRA